jgi:biopolymer transport protein ExbD
MKYTITRIAVLLFLTLATAPSFGGESITCKFPKRANALHSLPVIIEVVIGARGNLEWNGTSIDKETLSQYFADVAESDPQPIIELSVPDVNTPYLIIAPAVRIFQQYKLHHLWIDSYRPGFVPPNVDNPLDIPPDSVSHTQSPPQKVTIPFPLFIRCGTSHDETETEVKLIDLSLSATGTTQWNGEIVERSELIRRVADSANEGSMPVIHLVIDPHTSMLLVTDLILALQWGGGQEEIRLEVPS